MTFQSMGEILGSGDGPVSTDLGVQVRDCHVDESHGDFESKGMRINIGRSSGFERWSGCPICAGNVKAAEQREKDEREASEKQAHMQELLGSSNIPERFIDRTFDNYVATLPGQVRALNTCRYYVENFEEKMVPRGMGLIMSGQPGTGKNHLASAIITALLPRRVGLYTTFMGMMHMIRNTYDHGSKTSERAVIEKLQRVDLLVIDELGVQRGTEDEHLQLFGIIDARYASKRPTIILTNQDEAGLKRFVGDRLYDRLNETSKWIIFDWVSHRKPGEVS